MKASLMISELIFRGQYIKHPSIPQCHLGLCWILEASIATTCQIAPGLVSSILNSEHVPCAIEWPTTLLLILPHLMLNVWFNSFISVALKPWRLKIFMDENILPIYMELVYFFFHCIVHSTAGHEDAEALSAV